MRIEPVPVIRAASHSLSTNQMKRLARVPSTHSGVGSTRPFRDGGRTKTQLKQQRVCHPVLRLEYQEPTASLKLSEGTSTVRRSVAKFALLMNGKLDARTAKRNGGRPRWMERSTQELLDSLKHEVWELEQAIAKLESSDLRSSISREVALECSDIANFAMMIADVRGQL